MTDDTFGRLVLALERIAAAQERIADAAGGEAPAPRPRRRRRASNDNAPEPTVPISEVDRRRAIALAKRLGFIVPGGEGA